MKKEKGYGTYLAGTMKGASGGHGIPGWAMGLLAVTLFLFLVGGAIGGLGAVLGVVGIKLPQSVTAAQATAGTAATVTGSGAVCPANTGTTNLRVLAQRTKANSSGAVDAIGAGSSVQFFAAGATSPFETTTLLPTGPASSTNDPDCGSTVTALYNGNNAAYNMTVTDASGSPNIKVGTSANADVVFKARVLATMQLRVRGDDGVWNSTGGFQVAIPTGGSAEFDLRIKSNSAGGSLQGPFVITLATNDTNVSMPDTKIIGATPTTVPGQAPVANNRNAWLVNVNGLSGGTNHLYDFDEAIVKVHEQAQSGLVVGKGSLSTNNFTIQVSDLGGYIVNNAVVPAYTYSDGTSDTGATDQRVYYQN